MTEPQEHLDMFGVTPPGCNAPNWRSWIEAQARQAGWTDLAWRDVGTSKASLYGRKPKGGIS